MSSRRVILPKGVIKFRSAARPESDAVDESLPAPAATGAHRPTSLPNESDSPAAPANPSSAALPAESSAPKLPADTPKRAASAARLPALDLKEVQRKAYERGRKVALDEAGGLLIGMASKLKELMGSLSEARERDQQEISEFAMRLACAMAEDVVCTQIDQGAHDIRGMVRSALDEVLPSMESQSIGLELNPDDLARLPEHFEQDGQHLSCRADSRLPKGEFRISGGGAEFYAGLNDRLATMRERLLQKSRDASS